MRQSRTPRPAPALRAVNRATLTRNAVSKIGGRPALPAGDEGALFRRCDQPHNSTGDTMCLFDIRSLLFLPLTRSFGGPARQPASNSELSGRIRRRNSGVVSFGMRDQVRKVPHAAYSAPTDFTVGSVNSQETLTCISCGFMTMTRLRKRADHRNSWTDSKRSGLTSQISGNATVGRAGNPRASPAMSASSSFDRGPLAFGLKRWRKADNTALSPACTG